MVARAPAAMSLYFDSCFAEFDLVLIASSSVSQNGDDAIELFYNGNVIETFGDINVDGSGTAWEYTDSWAYKDSSGTVTFDSTSYWTFGGINCTDGTNTIYETQCPYPLCPLPLTSGCTDPLASNFDPSATYNDGTCLYPCLLYTSPSPRD